MQNPIDKTKKTYDEIASQYDERYQDITNLTPLAERFIKDLNGKRILDLGCAGGRYSAFFQSKGYEVIGIDISPEMIKIAQTNAPQCEFKEMDMRNLAFGTESFDGLWASASLLHLPKVDMSKTLEEIFRVLKPEGRLYFSVMEGNFEGYRAYEKLGWNERYFAHYTKEELRVLLEKVGFKDIDIVLEEGGTFPWLYCFAIK